MAIIRVAAAVVAAGLMGPAAWAAVLPSAQPFIDAAQDKDVVILPPGTYAGPLVVAKPIVLDGDGKVTIDGGGKGTVLAIETDGATVRGLRLVNSGESHNDVDAGIQVKGSFNVIKDNVIEDTLFGIDLHQSDSNVVRRNVVHSKDLELGMRGDAIRLWFSRSNRIEENEISRSRDVVVWHSVDNTIRGNKVSDSRYGLHFMYAQHNLVEDNTYWDNSVGIILMYSDGIVIRGNRVTNGTGATGVGIGLKETSSTTIEDNEIVYVSNGIYLDLSPFQPDTGNRIERNHVAFTGIGVLFHNDWKGNELRANRFEHNLVQVSVNARASAARNLWDGNYWDDYQGFDRDGDGIGDTPYELRVYADRLWMDVPHAAFFRGAPVLTLVDFLERLAPLTDPILLMRDDKPLIMPPVAGRQARAAAKGGDDGGEFDPFGLKQRLGK
ncbi:MAG: nitrous oxide reductase family maturation protein NosD [Magnetospirillum sp. WYHS-4]